MHRNQPPRADVEALLALHNAQRYAEAESRAHALLGKYPQAGFVWKLLGVFLHMQGKDALPALQKTAQLLPDDAGAHNNLGSALQGRGEIGDAAKSYRRAIKLKPDFAMAHANLGSALQALGQPDDALASYRRAVELEPGFAEAHNDLGKVLEALGRFDEAVASYRQAVKLKPDYAEAHGNLGIVLQERGQFEAAVASYSRALQIKPDQAELHNNLGNALKELGRLDDALASFQRAVKLKPDLAIAHNNLGNVLKEFGRLNEAQACYRLAAQLKPDFAVAHNNLGIILKDIGELDAAFADFYRALEIDPGYAEAYSNMLFTLNYTAHSPEYCLEEARKYDRMVAERVGARYSGWQCPVSPARLRVGLVTGDLRNHPVGHFMESLLANIDPARVELIAYLTHHVEDELTARIRPCFSAWEPLYGKSDEDAARLIHEDGVHVLLDLSGHTAHNRLPVFAWKPAPVQATWLGYFATTGMAEMDYIMGDLWTLPEGEAHHFVERGWRMSGPSSSCLTVPQEQVEVGPLPALHNHFITFGTLNNSTKMNDRVVACWARILSALPDSRLYLNMSNLRDSSLRKNVIARYAARGITADRLILEPTTGRVAALNSYNRIDIALDPFPYPGGTTSYEALWMGVPVLTMRGSNFISHLGESIMHNAGLPDWIAQNEEDCVAKAVAFSADLESLSDLRAGLRKRVLASPLFDAKRFARSFEEALWGMWQARAPQPSQQ